jgi:hypothetical protein
MDETPSLLATLRAVSEGFSASAIAVDDVLLVTLGNRHAGMWFTLDRRVQRVEPDNLEAILRLVANRLICCQNCRHGSRALCHHEADTLLRGLKQVLGERGCQRFLASAPLCVSN